jgi:hypothetical protein
LRCFTMVLGERHRSTGAGEPSPEDTIMTATLESTTTIGLPPVTELVPLDLYKDIHKGVRAALFAVTGRAGSIDPADAAERAGLAEQVKEVAWLLDSHAEHEDAHCQPAIEAHAPDLAAVIAEVHPQLEARVASLVALADVAAAAPSGRAPALVHTLYLELASFTGEYLQHQDFEERQVMTTLAAAMPFEEVLAVHQAIVGSIPPDEMARSLAIMLPAMNVDDRAQLLGGIRGGAPAEVFAGVCALAESVLTPQAWSATAARLGLT